MSTAALIRLADSKHAPILAAGCLAFGLLTGGDDVHGACQQVQVGQPAEHFVMLTANQPGVPYDYRAYKYYVEWRQSMTPDDSVVVQSFSRHFQPIAAVRDGASGRIIANGRPRDPLIEDNGIWWYNELEFTPRRSGSYRFILSTQNIEQGELTYTIYRYGCRRSGDGGSRQGGSGQGGRRGDGSRGGGSFDDDCIPSLGQQAC